jgi:valyl-tRNA synthetase
LWTKIENAREEIINDLKENGYLVKQEDITHIVNVHERCDTPVELMLSKQWFIKIVDNKIMDRNGQENKLAP